MTKLLQLLGNSSDLNPMENAWNHMKKQGSGCAAVQHRWVTGRTEGFLCAYANGPFSQTGRFDVHMIAQGIKDTAV